MAKLLKLRIGVADDPTALQPSLNDCLEAMLQQAELLVRDMLAGLVEATAPNSPKRVAGFQQAAWVLPKTYRRLAAPQEQRPRLIPL